MTTRRTGAAGRRTAIRDRRPELLLLALGTEHHYVREAHIGTVQYVREATSWLTRSVPVDHRFAETVQDLRQAFRVVGIVVFAPTDAADRAAAGLGIPAVNISARMPASLCHRVLPDNRSVGRLGAEHLLSLGLRSLWFCGYASVYYSQERFAGFEAAVRAAGATASYVEGGRASQLRTSLRRIPRPAGLMACNDALAVKVIDTALGSSVAVPDELAVIGADDAEIWCETANVSLSSVSTDGRRVGYAAARLIARLMQRPRAPGRPLLIRPHRVARRQSTDVAPDLAPAAAAALDVLHSLAFTGVSVEQIVQRAGMPRRSFDRHVAMALGRTPHAELVRLRVERARELLTGSYLPIAEVATRCGFSSTGYFLRVFRSATGSTPAQYRKAIR